MFVAKTIYTYLNGLKDPRREAILNFHQEFQDKIYLAKGSSFNHQSWPGGYADHIADAFRICEVLCSHLPGIRPVNINLDSALIVIYFHDLEKMWKYTDGTLVDKEEWYNKYLPERGITFTEEELNALRYTHGEGDDYRKDARVMNELAAICHAADNLSARLWFNAGRGLG